jgi:CRISPR-associated endonuclease Csn1
MKKILGLDLGTNSIGWALIKQNDEKHEGEILGAGSRIIPMSLDKISDFGKGNSVSNTSERTRFRGVRRLRERHLLRRERLVKVLKKIGWLSDEFDPQKDKITYKADLKTGKHLFQFEDTYQEMINYFEGFHKMEMKIPKDWTIYYLRKKALTEKITPLELSWIIMQFNQKRGYYELRSENEDKPDTNKEFLKATILKIEDTGDKRGKNKLLAVHLDNGMTGTMTYGSVPDWVGQEKELIATTNELKDGSRKITFSFPDENDWTLRKKKTESLIDAGQKTVGEYILEALVRDPKIKIRGKEVHTIERKYYKDELIAMLKKQIEFHPELQNRDLYLDCVKVLYSKNDEHRNMLNMQDFVWLFVNDIIFYQRPLKSKKYLIEGCKFERRTYLEDGEKVEIKVKAIPRSHPLFQEFRIWSLLHNLKAMKIQEVAGDGRLIHDVDVTERYLTDKNKEKLFKLFNESAEISHTRILKTIGLNDKEFKLNYEEDRKLPGNDTLAKFISGFKKADTLTEGLAFLNNWDNVVKLWHILYSLEKKDFVKSALESKKLGFPQKAVEVFTAMPAFKKDYGAYSSKAIRRLIPLMRCGIYWQAEEVEPVIPNFLEWKNSDEYNRLTSKLRNQLDRLEAFEEFRGLSLTLAEYVAYQRHSEENENLIYRSPDDIKRLKQHSLRNPIVEQVINETLMVVKDIWNLYGKPDEIHLEVGRDMKSPVKKRQEMSQRRNENEKINRRAKAMLVELKKDNTAINPFSVGQLELFKIYEEGALNAAGQLDDDIYQISRKDDPTSSEIIKYKLWLDQKYRSPYTGEPIPLAGIFKREFEIEHIFPQSRYFDDSFNNKVISETEVNRIKGNQTAFEFITNQGGLKIKLSNGKTVTILFKEEYIDLVKKTFWKNRVKCKNLLSYDIPESFIQRQLNDSRYISREIKRYLAPIVRKENEREATPQGLLPMVGSITDRMKEDWGLKEIWKELLVQRFQRMNEITGVDDYYFEETDKYGKRNFILSGHKESLKRLDHRHHALDALVIAAISRDHVNYLNSLESERENRSLIKKLKGYNAHNHPNKNFLKPWETFTIDAKRALERTVVSFKFANRIMQRGRNYASKWTLVEGSLKKKRVAQSNKDLWSIRKPFHQENPYGIIKLKQYKEVSISNAIESSKAIANKKIRKIVADLLSKFDNDKKQVQDYIKQNPIVIEGKETKKVQIFYFESFAAKRRPLDKSFTFNKIKNISNTNIKRILKKHLDSDKYNGDSEAAFSPEGIEELNKTLKQPIKSVRCYEAIGKKFQLGFNKTKYVQTADGTNLYFLIYENNDDGKRIINDQSTIKFLDIMDSFKEYGFLVAEEKNGYRWFTLSPGDLVYVPETDEHGNTCENISKIRWNNLSPNQINRIFIFEKSTKGSAYFLQHHIASLIKDYDPKTKIGEFESQNKSEKSWEGVSIKNVCIKLHSDRLGRIKPAPYGSDMAGKYFSEKESYRVEEPQATYQNARIQFFSSLEEENEATAKYMAERTPEESLFAARRIIEAMYRRELEKINQPFTHITFKKNGLSD